jgi:hypothetical protein
MKSQIQVFILLIFLFGHGFLIAQPKLSVDFGVGFYEPTLTGFDQNENVQFPTKTVFNRNVMINWGIYYEFFNNARIWYNSFTSFEIGKNVLLINSEAAFTRSIKYRMFPIETYFRWKPKIELNFTLAPIWGRGRIELDTTPGDKEEDWDYVITSFGGDATQITDMGATDAMLNDWLGYSSILGLRYYLSSRMAIDIKGGFMNNFYNEENWRVQRQKVNGPIMKIDDLPIFSLKFVYGLR